MNTTKFLKPPEETRAFPSQVLLPSKPLSPKYLRRTLYLNKDDGNILKRFNIKRLHIRKIVEIERGKEDYWTMDKKRKQFEQLHRVCLKKKLFKGLTSVRIYSLSHPYWIEGLKNAKKITYLSCEPYFHCPIDNIIHFFERISRNLETLEYIEYSKSITDNDSKKLVRAMGCLKKLKAFQRNGGVYADQVWANKQFRDLNRYCQRLPQLEKLECKMLRSGKDGLHEIMNQGIVYKKVTKNFLNLCDVAKETNHDNAATLLRLPRVFKFEIFPHLKELEIQATCEYKQSRPEYKSFACEGFRKVDLLEKLSLKMSSISPGLKFLLEGFLLLPQLKSLSIELDYLTSENWRIFNAFIKHQKNLVWFDMNFTQLNDKGDEHEPEFMQEFIENLSEKSQLQYLHLKANSWPLQHVSNGFKKVVNTDKIKSFELKTNVRDAKFTSPEPLGNPFEGLCEFLHSNKQTLDHLALSFPLLEEQKFNESLSRTISELTHVTDLALEISVSSILKSQDGDYPKILNSLNTETAEGLNPNLDMILSKLLKLKSLQIDFKAVEKCPPKYRKWMSSCFKAFPSLKNLRNLELMLPNSLSKDEANIIDDILMNLKEYIQMKFLYAVKKQQSFCPQFQKIAKTMDNICEQQLLKANVKVNLSF